jgi:hypothetical protein
MTDVVPWVICDELGEPAATIRAATREAAIKRFCYPALRAEAYFGTADADTLTGGWTCRRMEPQSLTATAVAPEIKVAVIRRK